MTFVDGLAQDNDVITRPIFELFNWNFNDPGVSLQISPNFWASGELSNVVIDADQKPQTSALSRRTPAPWCDGLPGAAESMNTHGHTFVPRTNTTAQGSLKIDLARINHEDSDRSGSASSQESSPLAPHVENDYYGLGARCEHKQHWERLRGKRGYSYFACRLCGAGWRQPTQRVAIKLQSEGARPDKRGWGNSQTDPYKSQTHMHKSEGVKNVKQGLKNRKAGPQPPPGTECRSAQPSSLPPTPFSGCMALSVPRHGELLCSRLFGSPVATF
mmetsp:Transcript_5554/g.10021  ORF Transcript_5554/g.10021 Transcript_5554/m.10021 type:complete len:273 (-) Transcript_5554:2343-3161(-)|eukprot:CAMPEP_0174307632 /NCGR_PEP_ID=MMETSP0810-20121108/1246_1 /TAXON_ID=73025 ORGANISM="Eutreptiella gymnastica-like, Strain CCMP1594" /NCGR_SAMPLE_ID=MMETSP0810 /ASSEMBLY_ACC=CAM_ASM_000659 /LENGTH=272 /DNA_ID=CAMNT_0015414743 /DNA_START=33 /DNA_END=851 /DNA_ORIENTATION=+